MIIEKVVAPENLSNKEPQGTRWIADLESGIQVWIQISQDSDKPNWQRLGDVYESYHLENIHYEPEWLKRFEAVIAIGKGDNQ